MVKFENVEIKYGNFVAMNNLNLDIKEGEFFTFLGPSGCGKTTSLRALVGFIKPSKGRVLVAGKDITNLPVESRNIGMVFQSYALFPTMTVYENIAFGMKVKKMSKSEISRKVHEVADKIKITEEQLQKNVSELSGGQQQRVALARAIVLEPKILCLDEPLSNLEAKLSIGMRLELKRLQKDLGITTLYVTHDQEEALTLSDRIAVFNNGYIEQVGTPYEIYNSSKSEFVCDFIGDINRFGTGILTFINEQMGTKLDTAKTGFVRIEKCVDTSKPDHAKIHGIVTDLEFNGILTKYTISCMGQKVKYLEKMTDINTTKKAIPSICILILAISCNFKGGIYYGQMENKIAGWNDQYPWFDCEGRIDLVHFFFSGVSECESDYSGIFPGWSFFSGSGGKDHEVPKSYQQFEEQLYFGGCFHYYGEYFRYFNRSVYRILRY